MKRTVKTEAIVLKKRSLPNQDTICSLFSKELGKVNAFAKGIKKITSRRLPHVQTANLIETVLYKKDNNFYLQETTLISGFSQIKKDADKIQILYRFFFVLERLLPENQSEPAVFNLALNFLVELSENSSSDISLLTKYLNNILRLLGYSKEDKPYEEITRTIEEIIHEKIPELHI
ncbi:DNA repair protein RecO [Candidatus Roizmanbacteria bacterium RIFCSPHIGHO2_02_FULL_37_15]|nr:MAG: DNA repair protein RecO [Candidatus Roizmanbacteria bacterium RIFCSPHIGHO2_01_FULL_37_16b]OGK20726.1 MAG: DNA repair protein RecO [Candidatus Roizmanbacteria bacterium RIFCSPHIGHO2_02_FULL_37_15]OGK33317.1 MAG: DNA repair protein RecO [Candidatus Roizmanbacteria bacterium RIFCSPHIGHO2_12_FULL_36_11]OGK57215.1 MAG: DNA repair protein RecO [Candidatus Roizmanbacteria bacterium RIFCSPLOWO2_02_FULL_37_9]